MFPGNKSDTIRLTSLSKLAWMEGYEILSARDYMKKPRDALLPLWHKGENIQ